MLIHFWGTRGSIATPGAGTVRYGGNTSCVQVTTDAGTLVVLDCGTGARLLGEHLASQGDGIHHGHILLTHTHWDHIQGFPFFAPVLKVGSVWQVYGPMEGEERLEQAMAGQMKYAYFPVELEHVGAAISFQTLGEGRIVVGEVEVQTHFLNHPSVTIGYRLEVGGTSLAYITDHEPFSTNLFRQGAQPSLESIVHPGDRRHCEFLEGVDLLIHDAQYTQAEYADKNTWGHSPYEYVVDLAILAGVKRLALFHHDPDRDDPALDALQEAARNLVTARGSDLDVFCAQEGQEIDLAEPVPTVQGNQTTYATFRPNSAGRILVVDDDPAVGALISRVLEADGHLVSVAQNTQEALASLQAHPPNLVILDVTLPDMAGILLLQRLRAASGTRNLPIIMITGSSDAEATDRGFKAGATDYMSAPFSAAQIRARVSEWLARSDPSSEAS